MLMNSSTDAHQLNFFANDLLQQLDPADPLLRLSSVIPWNDFDKAFNKHYTRDWRAEQADTVNGWLIDIKTIREPQ